MPRETGRCLVQQLWDSVLAFVRLRQSRYFRRHEPGRVIVWDNLSPMHTEPIDGHRVPRGELSHDLQHLARFEMSSHSRGLAGTGKSSRKSARTEPGQGGC